VREVEELAHVIRPGIAFGKRRHVEGSFDKLQDRSKLARLVRYEVRLDPWRDYRDGNSESGKVELTLDIGGLQNRSNAIRWRHLEWRHVVI